MKRLNLILICLALLGATAGYAGDALVTKVRGSRLVIDMGTNAGLGVGMMVTVVRPPGEAIIHPLSGENLGAPEVKIGTGEITKTSAQAATVRLGDDLLMSVRPGDIVRFLSSEEEMIMEQERTTAQQERNQQDHKEFRKEASRLADRIKGVQGSIGRLEGVIKAVQAAQKGYKTQLGIIHRDVSSMKEDIKTLKDQVALYGPIPVGDIGEQQEEGAGGLNLSDEEDVAQLKEIIRDVVGEVQEMSPPPPLDEGELELPPLEEDMLEPEPEEESFFTQPLFFGILGGLGLLGVFAFLYMKMTAASEEDEEDEEDDEEEEMDDDEELEVEIEEDEEDDIVVEETS